MSDTEKNIIEEETILNTENAKLTAQDTPSVPDDMPPIPKKPRKPRTKKKKTEPDPLSEVITELEADPQPEVNTEPEATSADESVPLSDSHESGEVDERPNDTEFEKEEALEDIQLDIPIPESADVSHAEPAEGSEPSPEDCPLTLEDNTEATADEPTEDLGDTEFGIPVPPRPTLLAPDDLFSDVDEEAADEEITEDAEEAIDEDGQYRMVQIEQHTENEDGDIVPVFDERPQLEKYDPEKPRKVDGGFDFIELFVFTLVAVMLLTTFFFRHSVVEGESMEGTLHEGEHLIISDLFYTPKVGDIIVCSDYTSAIQKPIVKRIIATAGQTVMITYYNGQNLVYVDGVRLNEEYVFIDDPTYKYRTLYYIVPEGEVFVMGDHRNRSTDSRVLGSIDEDAILGRVLVRFFPFDKFGKVN